MVDGSVVGAVTTILYLVFVTVYCYGPPELTCHDRFSGLPTSDRPVCSCPGVDRPLLPTVTDADDAFFLTPHHTREIHVTHSCIF